MRHYPWKHALVLTAVSYSSPPLCECSTGPCGGLLLLLAKPHSFPPFHHSSSLVGSHANSTWWRGRALELQKSLGLERRPEFPPSLGCPRPHPILPSPWEVSQLIHRAVCTLLTWSQPSQAPPGTRPLLDCPLKPPRPGSPDAKHDPVMSYQSVCVCIIQAKGWSYVTMQCKLTVLVCKRVWRLTADLNFKAVSLCWGSLLWRSPVTFCKSQSFQLECSNLISDTILFLKRHLLV